MKFKFPLQKVLDHRKIKENLAQKDFQDALNELYQLENKLRDLETALHEAHFQAGEYQVEGGAKGPALIQIDEFMRNQKILIERQKAKIANQERIVEEKRDLLRQAAIDTKIISRFKEKKFEEFREAEASAEQKEANEQSILRYKPLSKREN